MTTGRIDFDSAWLPVEYGDEAIERVVQASAVEAYARVEPMAEDTKNVPRFRDFDVDTVAKGEEYTKTTATKDRIDLVARKVGGVGQLAEEDITGALQADPLQPMRNAAGDSLARHYDNACLGVTAASNGDTVKYTSLYRALNSNGSGFDAGYTAGDNFDTIAQSTLVTNTSGAGFDALSTVLSYYEESDFFEESETLVIASPRFKHVLRTIKDSTGQPLLRQIGVSALGRPEYEFFGYPVRWSMGCVKTAVDTTRPSGARPLLFVGNRRHLIRGARALAPQIPADTFGWAMQRSQQGIGFLSDEAFVKAAFKRAFAVGTVRAWAGIELT